MLTRVQMQGIQLPRLYLAEDQKDFEQAARLGLPVVKWTWGHEEFIKMIMRPCLEKMFPGINWVKILGPKKPVRSMVYFTSGCDDNQDHTIADYDANAMLERQLDYDKRVDEEDHDHAELEDGEYRRHVGIGENKRDICTNTGDDYDLFVPDKLSVADYIGDLSSSVDIDALMQLGLLPKFVGDVKDCIYMNLSNRMRWTEGYTKKLDACLGNFKSGGVLPNLIIIDVSHSIPDGIAATMLTLADTLREQCNADLIITSRRSGYYPAGSKLPKPQTLRDYYGRSNESAEFMAILEKHVAGREWGHVISFGDNDNPGSVLQYYDRSSHDYKSINMQNTRVHQVHHYHTWAQDIQTGYARWVAEVDPNAVQAFEGSSWCDCIDDDYKMRR